MQPKVVSVNMTQNNSLQTDPGQSARILPKGSSSIGTLKYENPHISSISQLDGQEFPSASLGKTPGSEAPGSPGVSLVRRTPCDSSKQVPRTPIAFAEEISIPLPVSSSSRIEEKGCKGATPKMKVETDLQEKRKVYPVQATASTISLWQETLLPHLERILEHYLPKKESASIDLLGIGTSRENSRPTIVITCQSVRQLKGYLRKQFIYDESAFDLKIRKGEVRRSTGRRARETRNHRSTRRSTGSFIQDCPNRAYQQRPLSGASIGACLDGRPLPPGTYGGLILVDGQPYGMTVHHLLDPESEDDEEVETDGDDSYLSHILEDEEGEYRDDSEGFDPEDSSHPTMSLSNSDVSLISVIL